MNLVKHNMNSTVNEDIDKFLAELRQEVYQAESIAELNKISEKLDELYLSGNLNVSDAFWPEFTAMIRERALQMQIIMNVQRGE